MQAHLCLPDCDPIAIVKAYRCNHLSWHAVFSFCAPKPRACACTWYDVWLRACNLASFFVCCRFMPYRQCFALWLLHAASQNFHFCNSFRKLQQLYSCDLHQKTDNVRAAAVILSHMHIIWCAPEPRACKTSYNVLTETYNLASIFVFYILMLYCAGALLCGYCKQQVRLSFLQRLPDGLQYLYDAMACKAIQHHMPQKIPL